MNKWLPYAMTSSGIFVGWLLINQSLAPGHVLLAGLLALAIPLLTRPLRPLADPWLHKPLLFLQLMALSLYEIIRSCFNVSRIILFVRAKNVRSQFVRFPLELRSPYGLAMLSGLINLTPGTVWVEMSEDNRELAVHVFDVHDEDWWIKTLKKHYEQPLIAIFDGGEQSE